MFQYHLFDEPSFIKGMGRVLDVGSTSNVFNDAQSVAIADYLAMKSDWCAVGYDILTASSEYEQEQEAFKK